MPLYSTWFTMKDAQTLEVPVQCTFTQAHARKPRLMHVKTLCAAEEGRP